ncbi:hypothetical protein ACNKHX_00835 [Shigella flexneri]
MLIGKHFKVLVEVNDNKPFNLVTLPVRPDRGWRLRRFDKPHAVIEIQPIAISASGALQPHSVSLPALPSLEGLAVRRLQLSMDRCSI